MDATTKGNDNCNSAKGSGNKQEKRVWLLVHQMWKYSSIAHLSTHIDER